MNFTRISQLTVVLVLLVSAVSGTAVAQSDSGDGLYESLEDMVPVYNENADSVNLGPLNLAGTSNIYIQDGDSVVTYSMTMNGDNRITSLTESPSEDAKRKVTTDRATIERLTSANNPAAAFRTAVANDDIVITGEDDQLVERVRWRVVNFIKPFFL